MFSRIFGGNYAQEREGLLIGAVRKAPPLPRKSNRSW